MGGRGVDIEASLARKINVPEVRSLAVWAAETSDNRLRLWNLAKSDDRRVSVNALWVMTHLAQSEPEWAASLQDELIDMVVVESDMAKKRMLLQILKCQEFDMENIRTDFLDWCLSEINSECEPCAVRTFSIYAAFKMCRFYPELLDELNEHLSMMSHQRLSAGLMSARRRTVEAIGKMESARLP